MGFRVGLSLVLLLSVLAAACGAGPETARPSGANVAPGGTSQNQDDNRTLIIAVKTEPTALVGSVLNPAYTGNAPEAPWQIFHASLMDLDEKANPHPQLAEALPKLGTDTWTVSPDGQMEMTWRLRPNLTWHDGAPLTADDFVLANVFSKLVRGGGADEVLAPDPRTVVVRYKSPNAEAADFRWMPVPRHIVGPYLEQMEPREAFSLPYWTTEFVGAGPYKLERWEPGAFILGSAFPGYVGGKPRIGRIQITPITDTNTTVANMLSGAVHVATDMSVVFDQVSTLRREWMARNEPGSALVATARTVYVRMQWRPDYMNPAALADVRLRQALAHTVDKQAIVDAVLDGELAIADTLIAREADFYPELDRVLAKHPFDVRRAEQLLTEMGYTKDAEGLFGQGGTRLTPSLTPLGGYQREGLILTDVWKRAGVDTPLRTLSAAEQLDGETQSTYPALSISNIGITTNRLPYFTTSYIPSPADRWSGQNRGGYSDPEMDRLFSTYIVTLDKNDQNRVVIQAMKYLSEQAAYFPLYYAPEVVAHAGSVVGPQSGRKGNSMWKLEQWTWR